MKGPIYSEVDRVLYIGELGHKLGTVVAATDLFVYVLYDISQHKAATERKYLRHATAEDEQAYAIEEATHE